MSPPRCPLLLSVYGASSIVAVTVYSNRSGCENRNHAAACDFWALLGSSDGAASPRKAASCAAVRYSKTLRCCCFNVATTVIRFATKRAPSSLCVPTLPLRHSTPGRSARSAVVCVGATPSTCTKVHNAARRCTISWQVPSVLAPPTASPLLRAAPPRSAVASSRSEQSSASTSPRAPDATMQTSGAPAPARRRPSPRRPRHDLVSLHQPAAPAPSTADATSPGTSGRPWSDR